jgi:hypothetical protein
MDFFVVRDNARMNDEKKIENVSPAKMVGRVSPLTAVSICGSLPSLHRPSAHQKSSKSFPLSPGVRAS